jgi:hypothetical protein
MTDDSIEAKALALVNEVSDKHTDAESIYEVHRSVDLRAALCRALEQHEAFKQEVSYAAEEYIEDGSYMGWDGFDRFIIPKPKPDPLVAVVYEVDNGPVWGTPEDYCNKIRAALDALGFEIREKGQ